MPSALSPPSWASGMVVTCLSHSPLAAHSSRDFSWEGLGIGGALSMIFFSSAALPALGVWDPTPGASAHVAFPGSSSAALPALGLWDLTPGPSAHFGCSGSSSAALPALGLWDLTPNPSAHVGCSGSSHSVLTHSVLVSAARRRYLRSGSSAQAACAPSAVHSLRQSILFVPPLAPVAHSLPPPKALPELRDSAAPSAYAHCCIDLAASGSLAHPSAAACLTAGTLRILGRRLELPDPSSPASFRITAASPMSSIYEISNEIMAPMAVCDFGLAGALLSISNLIEFKSELRCIGLESMSESQHRRLTSLASTGLRRSSLRPPLALFDFNSVTVIAAFVLTATIRFKSSLKRLFDLTAWFDFKFKGFIHRTFELQAPHDLTSNKSLSQLGLSRSIRSTANPRMHLLMFGCEFPLSFDFEASLISIISLES
ncbi:hypothetical protein B0H15DRAFT_805736 [Mycena belliarum]|uniref:Uncharacterized protein n=1 Tax=Mycena belliarum TaxID=1033014 RepID=A0AAD6TVP2_9AGAR|nr:hypothetical protein B0H15DRAFT_805736 [Mycena belliae]